MLEVVPMEIKKYHCRAFKTTKRQGTEFQGPLYPAEANLGYFLAWFQSLQLPPTQSQSPLALIPLAPKSHVSF
jgi:hypothetical protein